MSDAEPRIYVYKMTTDNGGAPCVFRNRLSLAICKPKIRKSAVKESLIFGFGGKGYQERLIYIARVTDKLGGPVYYREQKYADRPDCIYRDENGKAKLKDSARYHNNSDERERDVGLHFEKAFVLLSKDFRYFGKNGTCEYKNKYSNIRELIENLTQGHRRNFSNLRAELLLLKAEIWSKPGPMKGGPPTENDYTRRCNDSSPSVEC